MAIKGISLIETEPFYSSFEDTDTPENEKTKWLIGAVDVGIRSHIQDYSISWVQQPDGSMQMVNRGSYRDMEMCRFGLKGFENFPDDRGGIVMPKMEKRIMFGKEYDVMSDDVLNKIPGPVLAEIANRIIAVNTATDTLRKK